MSERVSGREYRIGECEGGKAWAIEWRESELESWDALPFRHLVRADAERHLDELVEAD